MLIFISYIILMGLISVGAIIADLSQKKPPHPLKFLSLFIIGLIYVYCCVATLKLATFGELLSSIGAIEILCTAVAATGIWAIVFRKKIPAIKEGSKFYPYRRGMRLSLVFAVCFLFAFVLEISLFNYQHYASVYSGKPIETLSYCEETHTARTNERAVEAALHELRYDNGAYRPISRNAAFLFKGLNQPVTTLHIKPDFAEYQKTMSFQLAYSDMDQTLRYTRNFKLVDGLPFTEYVHLETAGNVTELYVVFQDENLKGGVISVTLSGKMPMFFTSTRVLLLAVILFAAYFIKTRHKKIFGCVYDDSKHWQCVLNRAVFAAMLVFVTGTTLTSVPPITELKHIFAAHPEQRELYSHDLVDALLAGRYHLDYDVDPKLLVAERPYDPSYRAAHGINYRWDMAYFDGHYYSYFGIAPVFTLFLPYKAITGMYLPTHTGVMIFGAMAFFFLMMLWRELTRVYMKKMPFVLYILGLIALPMCSLLTWTIRRPAFYEVPVAAGLAFASCGVFLLVKATASKEYPRPIFLSLGCLMLALTVGCRPTMLLISLLVPIFLWKWLKEFKTLGLCRALQVASAVAVPYAVVGIYLMWYNYARFGNIAEFGMSYQLTLSNIGAQMHLSPTGMLSKAFIGLWDAFFSRLTLISSWPFFLVEEEGKRFIMGWLYDRGAVGIFTMPLGWALLGLAFVKKTMREKKPLFAAVTTMFVVSLVMSAVAVMFSGVHPRYATDFFWMLVLCSLICTHFILRRYSKNEQLVTFLLKLFSGMIVISIIMGASLNLVGADETLRRFYPEIFYQLERTFDFFGIRHF